MSLNEWLYSNNYQSFKEWKSLLVSKEVVYPSLRIPYGEWLEEYICEIEKESIKDVKVLIRCLLGAVTRKQDLDAYSINQMLLKSENESLRERAEKMAGGERLIRLSEGKDAWEGITWILDLLPVSPFNAIQALESYLYSQSNLPDDRIIGIEQCIDIIYAKFIYSTGSLKKIMSLKPVEFEWYIEALYESMGYNTLWTTAAHDGGKDIIATNKGIDGGVEQIYVECKLYQKTHLTIEKVRAFSRVLDKNEVNRGVIFCTGYVSKNLKSEDKRIYICTYDDMYTLFNAHMGSDWSERVEIIVDNKRRKYRS